MPIFDVVVIDHYELSFSEVIFSATFSLLDILTFSVGFIALTFDRASGGRNVCRLFWQPRR